MSAPRPIPQDAKVSGKVKVVDYVDNDTYKVTKLDEKGNPTGSTFNVRLHGADAFESAKFKGQKDQPGLVKVKALQEMVGKTVDYTFKSEDTKYGRPVADLSFNKKSFTSILEDAGQNWKHNGKLQSNGWVDTNPSNYSIKNEVQTDSLLVPSTFRAYNDFQEVIKTNKGYENLTTLKGKSYTEILKKFPNLKNKEGVDAFVLRQYARQEAGTLSIQKPQVTQTTPTLTQSIMATPVKNKSLKVSGKPEYKDSGKSYKTIGIDEANALINNNEIVGTKVDQLRQELEQSGYVKDLAGYELHDANGTKYLFPIFKGDSQKNFKQALKSNQGEELSAFGNRYATSEQAIKTWKDQFGISPTHTNSIQDNVIEVAKNNGTAQLDYTKTAVQPFNPLKNVEKNSGFLTKNLILPKKDKSVDTGNSDPAIKDWGSALASIVFNIGSLGVVEPITSGVLNSTANAFTRKATGRSYTDDLGWNLADDLLGFSGAAGYVTGAGFAGEAASTANSARKIFKQVSTIKNVLKTNKALKTTLLAGITAEYGQEVGKEIYNLIEKPDVTMDDIIKSSGRLAMLAPDLLMAKKRFKKGFTEGAKPFPVPEFKKGGILKFQRGGGIPKFQNSGVAPYANGYQPSVWNPTTFVNTPPVNYSGRSSVGKSTPTPYNFSFVPTINNSVKPRTDPYFQTKADQMWMNSHGAGLNVDGKDGRLTGMGRATNYMKPLGKPAQPYYDFKGSNMGTPTFTPDYTGIGSGDFSTMSDKPKAFTNNRSGFGYQEANLALSVLPALLNTKVKADRLTYQPYNPMIRGIQGDPLLQQRLTSVAQNKYLQNKATSSDPTQELVRRLVVNRQAMQANQEAYNIDTQARIADTQRYYSEKNAADQYNYTNKQNTDNQNVQMNNNAMMQNAAQKNQVMGQTIQNIMGYMTNKANNQTLLGQNYLVHKNQENQRALNMLAPKYASMYNALESSGLKETNPTEYARRSAEISQAYNQEYSEKQSGNSVNNLYAPNQQTLQRAGVWKYKKGGTISEETKVLEIVTRKATNLDKVFIDSARKYNELSSKVSTEALNRGSRLVVNALNNLPKTTFKSLPFKKLL